MNLGRRRMIPKYFRLHLEPYSRNRIMKRQNNSESSIYIKSRKKNKWEGNLQKIRILHEVTGRISWKYAINILECDCYMRSWSSIRKFINLYIKSIKNLEFLLVFFFSCKIEVVLDIIHIYIYIYNIYNYCLFGSRFDIGAVMRTTFSCLKQDTEKFLI